VRNFLVVVTDGISKVSLFKIMF